MIEFNCNIGWAGPRCANDLRVLFKKKRPGFFCFSFFVFFSCKTSRFKEGEIQDTIVNQVFAWRTLASVPWPKAGQVTKIFMGWRDNSVSRAMATLLEDPSSIPKPAWCLPPSVIPVSGDPI